MQINWTISLNQSINHVQTSTSCFLFPNLFYSHITQLSCRHDIIFVFSPMVITQYIIFTSRHNLIRPVPGTLDADPSCPIVVWYPIANRNALIPSSSIKLPNIINQYFFMQKYLKFVSKLSFKQIFIVSTYCVQQMYACYYIYSDCVTKTTSLQL